jgi:imidazolonepropionase-like amidohydrolase
MRRLALAILLAACGSRAPAVTPAPKCFTVAPKASHATVLRNARVFDGVEVLTEKDVLLVDGVIASVDAPTCIEAGGAMLDDIDLSGRTIMPGMIDAHIHAGDSEEALEQALVFGVTTLIDMFGPPERLRLVRAQELAGEPGVGADLRGAGVLATSPGGHGTEYGIDIPTLSRPEEAAAFVDARFAEGSDFLKIVLERVEKSTLDRETAVALAAAAHARGRIAHAHVGTMLDAADAVAAGIDGIEHTPLEAPLDAPLAAAIAEKRVTWTPTLSMTEMHCGLATGAPLLADPRITPLLTDAAKKRLARVYKWAQKKPDGGGTTDECLARAIAAVSALNGKTPILAGTDSPNGGTAFGASLHRELELLVKMGLSPRAALIAATSAPARAFHLDDRGRIAPGLRADVVIVEGDPTVDILATRSIRAIYQRGVKIDRWAISARSAERKPRGRARRASARSRCRAIDTPRSCR